MEEVSTGAMVPAVKPELSSFSADRPPHEGGGSASAASDVGAGAAVASELEKDLLCPICLQMMKDAFMTACGHSFCYMCIATHLRNKSDCPCCGQHLTSNQLFPNFLLNKLLKKTSVRHVSKTASPIEHLRRALLQGCEVSIKELDTLLTLVAEKKRKMEQEEAEKSMQILQSFLHCLRKQKADELNEIQADLQYIKEDINAVEKHRIELYRARDRYSVKLQMLGDDPTARKSWPSSIDKNSSESLMSGSYNARAGHLQNKKGDGKSQVNSYGMQRKDALSGPDSQYINQSGLTVVRKKRIHAQFNDLQDCYLQKRRQLVNQPYKPDQRDTNVIRREGYSAGLADFQSVLTTFTRYRRLRVIAELRHGDLFRSANIVSSARRLFVLLRQKQQLGTKPRDLPARSGTNTNSIGDI